MDRISDKRGFTLIELLVVITILGILASIVAPRILGRREEALRTKVIVQIRNLEQALKLYYVDNGVYPSTEQGLVALVEKPTIGVIPKHWKEGGYLEKNAVPSDPWGNPFVYISPGVHNRDFDLKSYGADGIEGGDGKYADIENWSLEK